MGGGGKGLTRIDIKTGQWVVNEEKTLATGAMLISLNPTKKKTGDHSGNSCNHLVI